MTGKTDLPSILKSLDVQLDPVDYVFCTFKTAQYGEYVELSPIASFTEEEGMTFVIPVAHADQYNIEYEARFKRITLGVHSSLQAVGLTAAIATRLAEHNISANVVAAFYHDHVFVPTHMADSAIKALSF